ncbi:MAG: hypothetical protein ACFB11_09075 [Paracoccaceae bacterium]
MDNATVPKNIVEWNHGGIKRRIRSIMEFKAITLAAATLDGIETARTIRKGQLGEVCPFEIFAGLAA